MADQPPEEKPKRQHPRRSRPRSRVVSVKRLTRGELAREAITEGQRDELVQARPRTRGDCRDAPRPCPFVSCSHHLYLEINEETGSIKLNFPDLDPMDLVESCSLDIAERGGHTLEEIGQLTNLTRERVRQVEVRGLLQLRQRGRLR